VPLPRPSNSPAAHSSPQTCRKTLLGRPTARGPQAARTWRPGGALSRGQLRPVPAGRGRPDPQSRFLRPGSDRRPHLRADGSFSPSQRGISSTAKRLIQLLGRHSSSQAPRGGGAGLYETAASGCDRFLRGGRPPTSGIFRRPLTTFTSSRPPTASTCSSSTSSVTFRARSIAACLTWGAAARHSVAPPQPQLRAREQVLQVIRGKADPMTGKLPLNALSGGVLGAKVGSAQGTPTC